MFKTNAKNKFFTLDDGGFLKFNGSQEFLYKINFYSQSHF